VLAAPVARVAADGAVPPKRSSRTQTQHRPVSVLPCRGATNYTSPITNRPRSWKQPGGSMAHGCCRKRRTQRSSCQQAFNSARTSDVNGDGALTGFRDGIPSAKLKGRPRARLQQEATFHFQQAPPLLLYGGKMGLAKRYRTVRRRQSGTSVEIPVGTNVFLRDAYPTGGLPDAGCYGMTLRQQQRNCSPPNNACGSSHRIFTPKAGLASRD
jgi:hypothetical protein